MSNIKFHENAFNDSGVAPCTPISDGLAEEQIDLNALQRCESAENVPEILLHISHFRLNIPVITDGNFLVLFGNKTCNWSLIYFHPE